VDKKLLKGLLNLINVERTYYLIRIYFGDNNQNSYQVFQYSKSRRFTANQAWQHIYNNKPLYEGKLSGNATIETKWDIIEKYKLNSKLCDTYSTFGFIH
jgi:hypothetical protein